MDWLLKYYLHLILLVALGAIIAVAGFYFGNFQEGLLGEQEVWGMFGDYIGGTLNPLLAFLSLIALLITIRLQSNELRATREELELTRQTIQDQTSIQDLQRVQMEKQFFDNHFFNSLDMVIKSIEKLELSIELFKNRNTFLFESHYDSMFASGTVFVGADRFYYRQKNNFIQQCPHEPLVFYRLVVSLISHANSNDDSQLYLTKLKSIIPLMPLKLLCYLGVYIMDEGQEEIDESQILDGLRLSQLEKDQLINIYPKTASGQ